MPHLFFGPDGSALTEPKDVIKFLGKKEKHWDEKRSAYQAAHSWFAENVNGLPPSIRTLLNLDSTFVGAVLEKAIFENRTELDTHGRGSQTDILAFVRIATGPAVLGVEAKVDESFGPLVQEWNDHTTGRLRRLVGLLDKLKFEKARTGELRYQLLHRAAATLIEAQKCGAQRCAMVVQSFDKNRAGFDDFQRFAEALGTPVAEPGKLSSARKLGDVTLQLGWTENEMMPAMS